MQGADSTDKDFVEYLQSLFKDYYIEASHHMLRKEYMQKLYDGDIDQEDWSTMSEIYNPIIRRAVKSVLPDIMNYIFPMNGLVSLIPRDEAIPYDTVRDFERALDNMLQYKMQVRKRALPILQDGLKFGAGYGVVEKQMITSDKSRAFTIQSGGKVVGSTRKMGVSATPTIVPSLRYIPYECIIPSPDGCCPEDVSLVIHIDYMKECDFDNLYRMQEGSEVKLYKGDPEKIKQNTLDMGIHNGIYPHFWNMMILGGESTPSMQARFRAVHEIATKDRIAGRKSRVMMIPIVKYYFSGEQVWLANGNEIIYHDKDSFESLRKPILKASPDMDSDNWWAMSDAVASKDMAMGVNMYQNALMDLLTQYLRPTIIYDETRYGGTEVPRHQPWGVIPVHGKVTDAFTQATPPQVAPGMFGIGDNMAQQFNDMNAVPLAGQASPGMVRGGTHALESMLQTTNGRTEFAGLIFDMGFTEPLVMQSIIQMQTLPQEVYEYIELKDKDYVQNRMTIADVMHSFDVNVDNREKLRNSAGDKMAEMNMFVQVYSGNPRIRQDKALERVIANKEAARDLICTDQEYQTNLEQMQQQINPTKPTTQQQQSEAGSQGRDG